MTALAVPLGAACFAGRDPSTCEFKTGNIDYYIESSQLGGTFLTGGIQFTQLDEAAPYVALLVRIAGPF